MKIQPIQLHNAIIAGAKEIRNHKEYLNKINFYPVADGDTGTNLAATMNEIIQESRVEQTNLKTLESIVDASLNGARGNSGIIFAQFINAFFETLEENEVELDIKNFIQIMQKSVPKLYKTISNPVEGTILSVIKDWANNLKEAQNFKELFEISINDAYVSLEKTKEILPILKKYHAVDSGAQAFVYFLEGIIKYLNNEVSIVVEEQFQHLEIEHYEEITQRYCCEAIIKTSKKNEEKIKEILKECTSTVLLATKEKIKIHTHANNPIEIYKELNKVGEILSAKVDDMVIQNNLLQNKKNIAILTDSIADIPKSLIEQYNISVLPVNVEIDNSIFLDKITIDSNSLQEFMEKSPVYPTTSSVNIKLAENYLNYLVTHYDNIICITVSSKMSSTYSTLQNLAKKYKQNIVVIDSLSNSIGEGLIVQKACELVAKNIEINEIAKILNDVVLRTKIFVGIDSVKYMVKGGRISKNIGKIFEFLNFKPIISIDEKGKGIIYKKTFKSNIKELVKISKKYDFEDYAFVNFKNDENLKYLEKEVFKFKNKKANFTADISAAIALNAGVGAVAIAFITKEEIK